MAAPLTPVDTATRFDPPPLEPSGADFATALDRAALAQASAITASGERNPVVDALLPDALVVGETHGNLPGVGDALKGGNFALYGFENNNLTYFGARPVRSLPPIPTPLGEIKQGISIVGTANAGGQEGGLGYTAKVPTPAGDMLIFINGRSGDATLDRLLGGEGSGTVSVNLGAAYSATDGGIRLAAGTVPGAAFVAAAAERLSGFDGWVGAAYRATAMFDEGRLVSVKIGDVDLPIERLGEDFGLRPESGLDGPDISDNALAVGGILFNAFLEGGADVKDAAAWTQDTYDGGGLAALTQKARETLAVNVPNDATGGANVTDGAFRDLGMGDEASGYAKEAYDLLRASETEGETVPEAWSTVWAIYLEGYNRGSLAANQGLRDGGNAGGLEALKDFVFDLKARS